MTGSPDASADTLVLSFGIFVIAVLAWLYNAQFSGIEQVVSHAVFDGLANSHNKLAAPPVPNSVPDVSLGTQLMRFGITAAFATCGTIAAYRLPRSLRLILFGQLLALNLVLHCILSMSGETLAMPLSLLIASTTGLVFGSLIKRMKEARHQLIAKDTAIENLGSDLSESTLQLIKDDETERRVLAGDLHDQVLNDLKLLRERLNKISKNQTSKSLPDGEEDDQSKIDVKAKADLESELQAIDLLIVKSMQEIREVMDSLSPAVLQHLGFVDALEDCVRNGAERGNYKVRFRCNVDHDQFNVFNQTELTLLYRLVQESITNICKHAQAKVVKCIITADGANVNISITDDGKGMDHSNPSGQSRGLRYMHQRARIIGATVNWLPGEDNKGTTVSITIRKPEVLK